MKTFIGTVVRAKTAKTAHVQIERLWMHPVYKKKVKRTNVVACHDEIGVKPGQTVVIGECKPVSATKRFTVVEVTNDKE